MKTKETLPQICKVKKLAFDMFWDFCLGKVSKNRLTEGNPVNHSSKSIMKTKETLPQISLL